MVCTSRFEGGRPKRRDRTWLSLVNQLDFSWLMLWICFIYFAKLESSIVKLNRSVSVLGQRGVACSHTTMLAILDHSRAGMIGFFFAIFF